MVFYKASQVQVSNKINLKCDNPGIVMLKYDGENVTEISVSDPNRELGKMHISVSTRIEKIGENFNTIWNEKEKASEISVNLPNGVYAGNSITVKLR